MRARGTLTDRTSFETPSWARRSTWASSTASPGGRRPSSRCWSSSAGRIFWFGNGGSAICRMTTSGPPTAATTGSPAPPAVASAAWIAWASCRGSAAGSTGLKARPATTTSLPRSSRQSALTDPLPMSRPMARRFRKSLRPMALSTTHRPFRGVRTRAYRQITYASKVSSIRMGSGKDERGAERPTDTQDCCRSPSTAGRPGCCTRSGPRSASREGSARDVPAAVCRS